jgi:hypothetical protein
VGVGGNPWKELGDGCIGCTGEYPGPFGFGYACRASEGLLRGLRCCRAGSILLLTVVAIAGTGNEDRVAIGVTGAGNAVSRPGRRWGTMINKRRSGGLCTALRSCKCIRCYSPPAITSRDRRVKTRQEHLLCNNRKRNRKQWRRARNEGATL